ncbi:hypothetical protein [Elioraea rosea]|uniref:hypothetical protein n=1 Tax=Elioraea rosea TaxID=2492390 RepID=UPI001186CDD9|nr:hypothetical protein [Elioraea rosea]
MTRDGTRSSGAPAPAPQEADGTELPAALMTLTLHMVESRIALMGDLARCGTVAEAGEVMTRWMGARIAEFGEDQARVANAMLASFSQAATAATEAIESANGLAKAGLEAAKDRTAAPH